MVKTARINLEGLREGTRQKLLSWITGEEDLRMPYVEIKDDYNQQPEVLDYQRRQGNKKWQENQDDEN